MSERLRYGAVFDGIADEYDARRSGYPQEIVAAAVEIAGLSATSSVVEVGAGTGKLTEELIAHGLRVDAVDPGANMLEHARRRRRLRSSSASTSPVRGRRTAGGVLRRVSRRRRSTGSTHVGWTKAAALLRPGGTIALVQPISVRTGRDGRVLDEMYAAFVRVAPEIAAERSQLRDETTIREGVERRRDNVSEAWAWLAHPGMAAPEAGGLFGPARLTAVPRVIEQTADELWAVFETTAVYHRLSPAARTELRTSDVEIIDRHGGTLRSTQLVALVTAQRRRSEASASVPSSG
jgi:SAM-dependent methyltransferase